MTPAEMLVAGVAILSGLLLIGMLAADRVNPAAPVFRGVLIAVPLGALMWLVLGVVVWAVVR
jgi:hypothetical protein